MEMNATDFDAFCDSTDTTIAAICDARAEAAAFTEDTRVGLNRFFLLFGVSFSLSCCLDSCGFDCCWDETERCCV